MLYHEDFDDLINVISDNCVSSGSVAETNDGIVEVVGNIASSFASVAASTNDVYSLSVITKPSVGLRLSLPL